MMAPLPTQMLNTFYSLISVEYDNLDKQLRSSIQIIERQAAASHAIGSSRTALLVCEAGAASLSRRCRMAWTQLYRVLSAHEVEVTADTAPEFLSELGAQASHALQTVRTVVGNSAVFRMSGGEAKMAFMKTIDDAFDQELALMKAEADLLVASSKRAKTVASQSVVINGNGNLVVTGDGNQVSSFAQIDSQTSAAIVEAMRLTIENLRSTPPEANVAIDDLKQIAEEVITEVEAPKPNVLKVKGAIKTVAETIKFIPSLKAAYESVRPAAAMLGIYLP